MYREMLCSLVRRAFKQTEEQQLQLEQMLKHDYGRRSKGEVYIHTHTHTHTPILAQPISLHIAAHFTPHRVLLTVTGLHAMFCRFLRRSWRDSCRYWKTTPILFTNQSSLW